MTLFRYGRLVEWPASSLAALLIGMAAVGCNKPAPRQLPAPRALPAWVAASDTQSQVQAAAGRIQVRANSAAVATLGDPPAALLDPRQLARTAPPQFQARFSTSQGDFVVKVVRAWGAYGADRFYTLIAAGFFDDVRFFSVSKGTAVKFGIHGHPAVSKAWFDARILDDLPQLARRRGMVGFVSMGPMTRTTPLFISLRDQSQLDKGGAVPFGVVTSGMDVVDKLYSGYGGEGRQGPGPKLTKILTQGNAYLEREFPRLDYIKRARIES